MRWCRWARQQLAAAAVHFIQFLLSTDILFDILIHCRNYDGFPGRALRDVVITVTVNYRNSSNAILAARAAHIMRSKHTVPRHTVGTISHRDNV